MRKLPWAPFAGFLAVFTIGALLVPGFLDAPYLLDKAVLSAEAGLLALTLTVVIVGGSIDLSVGSNVVLCACVAGLVSEKGAAPGAAALSGLLTGLVLGILNGVLVVSFRRSPVLVTLAAMAIYRGAAQALVGPRSIKVPAEVKGVDVHSWLGVPAPLLVLAGAAALTGLFLHRTIWGQQIRMMGGNEAAARYSGVPVDRLRIASFALTGLAAGAAGLLMASRFGVVRSNFAIGLELEAITISVVGGTSILGGSGTIAGTVGGFLLITSARIAMGLANVKTEVQLTVLGAILATAALLSLRRRS